MKMKKKILYVLFVIAGIALMCISLAMYQPNPFFPFNWWGLWGCIGSGVAFGLSYKFPKVSRYILFALGLFLMVNVHFYFKQCSIQKGLEVFGGFFISIAAIF